ncbi:MAG: sulfur oxidation c-type cytochrome SoxX [Rhizobiaceae bacterium]
MKMPLRVLVLAIAMAFISAVGATASVAQTKKKLKRCKDGEVTSVVPVKYVEGKNLPFMISASLTGSAGNAEAGLGWMAHRRLGNCLACHQITDVEKLAAKSPRIPVKALNGKTSKQPLAVHGKIGPTLDGVASRYTAGELRMLIVNPKKAFPETIMPAFHRNKGFTRVYPDCKDKTILSAEQVEDVLAFLKTLK